MTSEGDSFTTDARARATGSGQATEHDPCIDALRNFTSGLAHEGRNALQQIISCSELLGMELSDQPIAIDLVNGILEAGTRLHRMFDDVRAYTMKLSSNRAATDLSVVWRAAWRSLPQATGQTHRLIELELPADRSACVCAGEMEQVFRKLLENAVDACGGSGSIEVRCAPGDIDGQAAVSIRVRDSGSGWSAESLVRGCEPFFSDKSHGTGLGLPIARRIVEAHGGRVHLSNPAEGGAAVELVLPRDSA